MRYQTEAQQLQQRYRIAERKRQQQRQQQRQQKQQQRGNVYRDGNRPPALRASLLAYGGAAVLGSYLLAPLFSALAFVLAR